LWPYAPMSVVENVLSEVLGVEGPMRESSYDVQCECERSMSECWVYMLRCADGSIYIGSTTNLQTRIETHNNGNGPIFTAKRRPVQLAYSEAFDCVLDAKKRERQIKKWTRAKKDALIRGDTGQLHVLSQRRSR
jgi:putative endonuclease